MRSHQPTCPVVPQGAFGQCLIKRLQVGCSLIEIGQIPRTFIASKRSGGVSKRTSNGGGSIGLISLSRAAGR